MTTVVQRDNVQVIVKQNVTNVIAKQGDTRVVYTGQQGPQGIQGIPGPTGGTALQYTAGVALGGHRMVVLDATGNAIYADNLTPGHLFKVLGMTTGAAGAGAVATIQTGGELTEPSWNWDVALPVYLGTNGQLTQVAPAAPAFQLIVGFPISPTTLFINLREPISLI